MRRTALAFIFISVLLFSAVAGTQLVSLGKADPYFSFEEVQPDTDTKPPIISIFSPINNTIYSPNNFALTFNVTVGESKTASEKVIFYVQYMADWQYNTTYFYTEGNPTYFSYDMNLTGIPEGNHSILFYAIERGTYTRNSGLTYAFAINSSSTVFFTIDSSFHQQSEPSNNSEPFPTTTLVAFVSAASVAIAGLGLLVYFNKRKRQVGK
jgi:hypothetical protein